MTPGPPDHPDQRIWPNESPAAPTLASRLLSPLARIRARAAAFAAPPGIIEAPDGVTYKPLARTPLTKALAPAGPGHLDFAVTFPPSLGSSRSSMRIRATRDRKFLDLLPSDTEHQLNLRAALAATRPGDRVLLLGAGTGALTAHLADHVGPSGAVTAFEADAQSVAYARARYPLDNAAHERLTRSTLNAEPAAAAETVILTPLSPPFDPAELLGRLARPGRLLLLGPHTALASKLKPAQGIAIEPVTAVSTALLVRKLPAA